jgi:hypothetical protein
MLELQQFRKHKISLQDYDYKQDIQYRLFFSSLDEKQYEVLEEILFSPLKFTVSELSRNLEMRRDEILPILTVIASTSLIQLENDNIVVNKEIRKYFDTEMQKFDERFVPGMEHIQSLLKKVPIQVLPNWYQIPRSADNIFDSLVEKIFSTPQLYQRHLLEVRPQDEIGGKIFDKLFASSDLKLYFDDLKKELQIDDLELHEIILEMEFQFIGCLSYERLDDGFAKIITAFHEWKEYLSFMKNHLPKEITNSQKIETFRPQEYAFVEDLQSLINLINKQAIGLTVQSSKSKLDPKDVKTIATALGIKYTQEIAVEISLYIHQLVEKSLLLQLTKLDNGFLTSTALYDNFLEQDIERKAHFIYKHPQNRFLNPSCPMDLVSEKNIRELEKSLSKLSKLSWVYFDDFLKGCVAAIGENSKVELKKTGKTWRYSIPDYSEKEKLFIQIALLEWLFESGVVQTGLLDIRPVFRLTGLGRKLFS